MTCSWQVEIDPRCRQILSEHFPEVRRFEDVREFAKEQASALRVDCICGGFPCQPVSNAGKRQGESDERWLWPEFMRVIRVLKPRWVVVENVPGLLSVDAGRLFGGILRDLATSGFDAAWDHLPAYAFGAPSERDRVLIVANSERRGLEGRIFGCTEPGAIVPPQNRRTSLGTYVGETWGNEPQISLLDDGLSGQLAEFSSRATGNAVVPQVAEWIGRRIMECQ